MTDFRSPQMRNIGRLIPLLLLLVTLWVRPASLHAQSSCTVTVQNGDTLAAIAARNATTVGSILAVNPQISNPNLIRAGQEIQMPGCGTLPAASSGAIAPSSWSFPALRSAPKPPADLPAPHWQRAHDATITIRHPVDAPLYSGSGIVVGKDGRTFLTAYHVIGNVMTGEEASRVLVGPFGNWHYTADVIATDPTLDLAILRVNEPDFPGFAVAPLGSSFALDTGSPIYTLSYPGIEGTLVAGKGSFLAEVMTYRNRAPLIVTDALADFGSSGGVAVNERGEVIGIISAGIIGREAISTLGYTGLDKVTLLVPIEAANALLEQVGIRR